MTHKTLRALVVEDSVVDTELLLAELRKGGYHVTHARVDTADAMTASLANDTWDIVLSDFTMPTFAGMEALAILQASGRDLPFIMISGTVGEETAVSALKAGANDFLVKGRLARLIPAIDRELRDAVERRSHRELEEQFRQAQKMEAIGQLAGSVAHDFNNMLTAILGYTELLTEQIGPEHSIGRDLREVVAAAQRAAALTRQLLAFSRKQTLAVVPLDLTTVVRDVEPMLRRLIGERITVETVLAEPLHRVLADATQLDQVLMNLSVNARDAMPNGGRLTFETSNVEHDAEFIHAHPGAQPGSFVRLVVRDTGIGMTPAIQAKIFEPFFTTKERGHGTGLGLSAVYGIVKQCGGYMWVESQLQRGSAFYIDLPKSTREVFATTERASAAVSPPGKETILLVEDEPSVRQFAKLALQRYGYRVIDASDAEAALTTVEALTEPLHLILTDVVLPRMDGAQLAAAVKRHRPEIRVLLMSGYADWRHNPSDVLEQPIELLQKPFTGHALLTRVRELLGSNVK